MKEVIGGADIVFAAVPPDAALKVSREITPYFYKKTLYIDVSASTPKVKIDIDEHVRARGISFVDVAMLGALPTYKHKVPISASGTGVAKFIEKMKPYHMNITPISDQAGDASAVKLIRSVFMKGMIGLYLKTLQAAEKLNVSTEVLDSLSETMDSQPFIETLNHSVTSSSIHAKRRATELEGSIQMLREAGIDAGMSKASKTKLDTLADLGLKERYQGETPKSWKPVIEAYKES